MNFLHFFSKSRGPRNLTLRIMVALKRFGITSKKFEDLLKKYYTISRQWDFIPTFAVTSVILRRHPKIIRELSRCGIEFAIHGYYHVDYTTISKDEQRRQFKIAIESFKAEEIPSVGFRAPFLRMNGATPEVLSNLGFLYDSSLPINWNVIDLNNYTKQLSRDYDRLIDFYQPRDAEQYLSLPKYGDVLIEIPVSIPDDESIVDRLGVTDEGEIWKFWRAILERTYSRGELFTLQLHPERISICENALMDVLKQAKGYNPAIWITTLKEICQWWQEKNYFNVQVSELDVGRYRIIADCSDRATLILKKFKVNVPVNTWFDEYQSVKARDFILEGPKRPAIGIGLDSSQAAVDFLRSQGFIVERSNQPQNYGIYLNKLANFTEADEKPLYDEIERTDVPLLRYWRWPNRARSALAITGDIDSMTLIDFALRILENWRQPHNK